MGHIRIATWLVLTSFFEEASLKETARMLKRKRTIDVGKDALLHFVNKDEQHMWGWVILLDSDHVIEHSLMVELENSCLGDAMHIQRFASLDLEKYLLLHEGPGEFFYLTNDKGVDAVFTMEGYIEYLRLCPDIDHFRCAFPV
jgi:hypothetical protein